MASNQIFTCVVRPRAMQPEPIDVNQYQEKKRTNIYVPLYEDAAGTAINVPFVIFRGARPGPVVGITAALHGNELNGVRIIQHLLAEISLEQFSGSILCCPIANVPGFNAGERYFTDGLDLNHVFPGKPEGQPAEQYARAFAKTFLPGIDYLIDIHTASEGRVNTLYVRVDWHDLTARKLALNVNPQIILHSAGGDGTLRAAARKKDIPSITIEAGNPSVIQGKMVFEGEMGIRNVLMQLGMLKGDPILNREPVICRNSKWLRTTGGGILETYFDLFESVGKRQLLAQTSNAFGQALQEYHAPNKGIVIGMSANPLAIPGTRFCHLGTIGEPKPKASRRSIEAN